MRWRSLTSFLFVVVVAFVGTTTCYVQFRMITRNLHARVCVRRSYGTRSQPLSAAAVGRDISGQSGLMAWNQEGVET